MILYQILIAMTRHLYLNMIYKTLCKVNEKCEVKQT